jgi:transcriptional regulator with XRE-family HTH domain
VKRTYTVMRAIREKRGVSQAALAKMIGVSQGKISSWESGSVPCPVKRRAQIADALNVIGTDLGDLFKAVDILQ